MKRILTFGLVLLSFALQLQAQSEAFPRSVSIDVLGITIPNHPVELIYRKDNPRFTRRTSLSVRAETVDYASPVSRTFPFNSIGIQEQQGFNMQVGYYSLSYFLFLLYALAESYLHVETLLLLYPYAVERKGSTDGRSIV
ncbi:MAG: hypothetical protein AAFV78_03985, partial [Bacteroidota bacterium]